VLSRRTSTRSRAYFQRRRLHRRFGEGPTYHQVSAGGTGHAEAVKIVYDPAKVTYAKLLDVFLAQCRSLVKDKQFCDSGDQYRTAIFYTDEAQKKLAEETKKQVEAKFAPPHGLYPDRPGRTIL